MNGAPAPLPAPASPALAGTTLGWLAATCLLLELDTYPKPGLVSPVDQGAHRDMDAALLARSARTLAPFFTALAMAGAEAAPMATLRQIGIEAERRMLAATGGINTHRGAIFGLGLLAAAAGWRLRAASSLGLGRIVATIWGPAIASHARRPDSHGAMAHHRHGAGGARDEAAAGFPTLYGVGLPALQSGERLSAPGSEAARVHALMALVAVLEDTNLLHRGGKEGLAFARNAAHRFMVAGGVGQPGWRAEAQAMHRDFTARRLSPGGAADLLAMTLFAHALGETPS